MSKVILRKGRQIYLSLARRAPVSFNNQMALNVLLTHRTPKFTGPRGRKGGELLPGQAEPQRAGRGAAPGGSRSALPGRGSAGRENGGVCPRVFIYRHA